jgi:hypothetical protein
MEGHPAGEAPGRALALHAFGPGKSSDRPGKDQYF